MQWSDVLILLILTRPGTTRHAHERRWRGLLWGTMAGFLPGLFLLGWIGWELGTRAWNNYQFAHRPPTAAEEWTASEVQARVARLRGQTEQEAVRAALPVADVPVLRAPTLGERLYGPAPAPRPATRP